MNAVIVILLSKLIAAHATNTVKQSSTPPPQRQTIPKQGMDPKVRTLDKQSQEEGELSPENGAFLNNGHDTQAKFSKPAKQHTYSDDLDHDRFHLLAFYVSNYELSYYLHFALI